MASKASSHSLVSTGSRSWVSTRHNPETLMSERSVIACWLLAIPGELGTARSPVHNLQNATPIPEAHGFVLNAKAPKKRHNNAFSSLDTKQNAGIRTRFDRLEDPGAPANRCAHAECRVGQAGGLVAL